MSAHILLVDSDSARVERLLGVLRSGTGHEVTACPSVAKAKHHLLRGTFDLVLSALTLDDGTCADLQSEPLAEEPPSALPLALLATPGEREAARAIVADLGAIDYLIFCESALPDIAHRIEQVLRFREEQVRREAAEKDLTETRRWLANAERITRLGCWEWDVRTNDLTFSDGLYNIYNITRNDFDGTFAGGMRFVHPDDRPGIEAQIAEVLATRQPRPIEFRFVPKNGETRVAMALGDMDLDEAGEPYRLFGAILDITVLKEAERALRQSESRLRAVVEHMPVLMVAVDEEGTTAAWNRQCEEVTGYSRDEIVGNPRAIECLYPDAAHRKWMLDEWERCGNAFENWELQLTAKDGSLKTIAWTNISERFPIEGWAAWAIGIDVTNRKEAQAKLRQQQAQVAHVARLSTMGELVAGIAHEINQPLYAIKNYANACLNTIDRGDEACREKVRSWCEQTSDAAYRAAEIIRRLRNFSRGGEFRLAETPLNDILQDAVDMLAFEARDRQVDVTLDLCEPSPRVPVDRIQIQQVMVNLLHNAFDAMQDAPVAGRMVTIRSQGDSDRVLVAVEDRGPGFDAAQAAHLFDPFYTTKSGGMGIGLAISTTIIEAHGGRLRAELNEHGGATFCFTLPWSEGGAA